MVKLEAWMSGLNHRFTKPSFLNWDREFESHRLRNHMFFKTRVRRRKKPSAIYLNNKENARAMIKERLEYYNAFYNYEYKRIAIKNHKSRWGSCSKKGNLNFNYRLALLPQHLADYVIVHE